MSLDSYSGLKEEIASHLDRDDLSTSIDTFIDLAESRHAREIRIRGMVTRAQATISERYVSLPDRFLQMQTLRLLSDPVTVLSEVNLHEMNRRRLSAVGKPKFYTLHEEIEFDRAPDDSYTIEMIYWARFLSLSDEVTSNGLLERAPDCYLYASLVAASPWLVDDERIPVWESLYANARDGLVQSDRLSRHDGALFSKVSGPTP